jgi:hypothetical protein
MRTHRASLAGTLRHFGLLPPLPPWVTLSRTAIRRVLDEKEP